MLKSYTLWAVTLALFCTVSISAQDKQNGTTSSSSTAANTSANSTKIPANSKVYINPMDGFETYVAAALQKKKIPLMIVTDREQADFEIKGSVDKQKAGWAKTVFGTGLPSIDATMQVSNVKTGIIVFTNSSTKESARRGRKGSAEHLAKNLAEKMKNDGEMKD